MNKLLTIIILFSPATVYCHGDGGSKSGFWQGVDRANAQQAVHIQKVWDIYNSWPQDEPLPPILEEAVIDGDVSYKEAKEINKIIPELRRIRVARQLEERRRRIASRHGEERNQIQVHGCALIRNLDPEGHPILQLQVDAFGAKVYNFHLPEDRLLQLARDIVATLSDEREP